MTLDDLEFTLKETLKPFSQAALVTTQGQLLWMNYEMLADIGTFGLVCQNVQKYLNPKMGDYVLVNDPYSGGTVLSSLTLVTKLCLETESSPSLLLAVRIGFRPSIALSKSIEDEGIRIPPTPIAQNDKVNEAILGAIAAHPLCPQNFVERFHQCFADMKETVKKFNQLLKSEIIHLDKDTLEHYLSCSHELLIEMLSEMPSGETNLEERLDSGESIKLHLEIQDERLALDFRGTSPSQKVCLTDASTFGSCFGALGAFFNKPIPLNSGSFQVLQVTSPLGCLLNAKYPSPTFKGMTDGTAIVASSVLKGLSQLMPHRATSMSAVAACKLEIFFDHNLRFYDIVAGGTGAQANKNGCDGMSLWLRTHLQPRIEEVEKRFPLKILKSEIRENSGGKGARTGGHGLVRQYEVLQNATLKWVLDQTKKQPSGSMGAESGEPAQIYVTFKNKTGKQKTSFLESEGTLKIETGDQITVLSAGGGGWGAPVVSTEVSN